MGELKTFQTLYQKASNGKLKVWSIEVTKTADGQANIRTVHGYRGGKLTVSDKLIKEGKNIGKVNETTPFEQAVLKATSTWKKKLDKGYTTDGNGFKLLPMLAQNFEKRAHDIQYPAMAQPKLNGVRCLAVKKSATEIQYLSRNGKHYDALEHLTPVLLDLLPYGWIFDGEIYHHDLTFQEIIRRVKKYRPGKTEELQFWVYDIATTSTENTFKDRYADLLAVEWPEDNSARLTPTIWVKNQKQVDKALGIMIEQGFEGLIIRNTGGHYKIGHRSKDLQKYKKFHDAEFEIASGFEGTGLDKGCVVFVCRKEDGATFNVRPRGTVAQRKAWLKQLPELIGKSLTVRYQELSEDGIPIFPVGITIRDYE